MHAQTGGAIGRGHLEAVHRDAAKGACQCFGADQGQRGPHRRRVAIGKADVERAARQGDRAAGLQLTLGAAADNQIGSTCRQLRVVGHRQRAGRGYGGGTFADVDIAIAKGTDAIGL